MCPRSGDAPDSSVTALSPRRGSLLLLCLDPTVFTFHVLERGRLVTVVEGQGMSADELVLETVDDSGQAVAVVVPSALVEQGGVEQHLVEHIAELVDHRRTGVLGRCGGVVLKRFDELFGLLAGVSLQAAVVLPARPRAATPQRRHRRDYMFGRGLIHETSSC